MKTKFSATAASIEVQAVLSAVMNHARSKIISAADVWNIQRQKRSRVQRRFIL